MKAPVFVAAFAVLATFVSISSPSIAQQKTVKQCKDEWRANKAENQAKGIKEKDYVAQCRAASELAAGRATLLGLWGDAESAPLVHMALADAAAGEILVVSLACPDKKFPSVGALHPPAIRLERAIQSLYGYEPIGAPDSRPWLDLGFWGVQHPLGARGAPPQAQPSYDFLPVEGEALHQIPVGPVHAGIIEPGHFRFTTSGETVVRLEQRLGYVHKGIESLMTGVTIERAAKLAARTSGDSTVAYGIAFAHAIEAALRIDVPPRARYLRALMAELERLANHLGDIGAICNDASFSIMHAHCGILREHVLRAAAASFGHRLMMDRVVPGGVTIDLKPDGATQIRNALQEIRRRLPTLGDCAVDGGIFSSSYAVVGGVSSVVTVDLHIRGCPPSPIDILKGLIALLEPASEKVDVP